MLCEKHTGYLKQGSFNAGVLSSDAMFQKDGCLRARFCKLRTCAWSWDVGALTDWNVNWGIYHHVESKLLHGHGKRAAWTCPAPAESPEGIVRAANVEFLFQHPAWAPGPSGGFLLSTLCKWKMKNKPSWLMKRDEVLFFRYSDREVRDDESDRNLAHAAL